MENTKFRVRTQNVLSGTFTVETGIEQEGMLFPVVFNIALEKVVRILQENEGGLFINQDKMKIYGPIIDEITGNWRKRYNRELYDFLKLVLITSFIKDQRIQWLG